MQKIVRKLLASFKQISCLFQGYSQFGAMLVVTLALFFSILFIPEIALAESKRCPSDRLEGNNILSPAETSTIEAIWRDLHGNGASGGDGPLGCPVGEAEKVDDAKSKWSGVRQRFQRGWIGVGRGSSPHSEIAVIRGWDNWTIWINNAWPFKTFPAFVADSLGAVVGKNGEKVQAKARAAHWSRGGTVVTTVPTPTEVSLIQCPVFPSFESPEPPCTQLTPAPQDPDRPFPDRPFDAAAHLSQELLTTPAVNGFEERVDALFADWLPCYTGTPSGLGTGNGLSTDEDEFARAMVMMRRDSPCPLTGHSPRDYVKQSLLKLNFPPDMLPGTNSDNEDCPRKGELDVTLVQLLNLALKHREELKKDVFGHIKNLLGPWGVAARKRSLHYT